MRVSDITLRVSVQEFTLLKPALKNVELESIGEHKWYIGFLNSSDLRITVSSDYIKNTDDLSTIEEKLEALCCGGNNCGECK